VRLLTTQLVAVLVVELAQASAVLVLAVTLVMVTV
jgi:hypothetical protein